MPAISIGDVSLAEGDTGATSFEFAVSLSEVSAQPVTASVSVVDGSATLADGDYVATGSTVTFTVG